MSWFRRFLIWLGLIKPASWFPVDLGLSDRGSELRALFPTLKGSFRAPGPQVERPYRRLLPRYKGRPTFRYQRKSQFVRVLEHALKGNSLTFCWPGL